MIEDILVLHRQITKSVVAGSQRFGHHGFMPPSLRKNSVLEISDHLSQGYPVHWRSHFDPQASETRIE